MTKRTEKGQFAKGASGNPGGRPRTDRTLRELAQVHTAEAIEALVAIMRSRKSAAASRVSAAIALLDRGHGRPVQAMEHNVPAIEKNLPEMSKLEVARRIAWTLTMGVEEAKAQATEAGDKQRNGG